MSHPSPEQIADIIFNRRQVYGLDVDSHIRQAANRFTARALFELLARMDDQSPDFASRLSEILCELPDAAPSFLIGFDSGDVPTTDEFPASPDSCKEPSEHYLRLVFRNEDAAYYQFHLFPDLNAEYIAGAARKRAGAAQYIRVDLTRPETLQSFIESCRSNPHFVRVEESTAEEFQSAPSHAV